ncbi:MAG: VCBS repeat-containing protein [Deltaproteobacteria bacterium]|nr:VCBS repeat-containing protein [Deltaproteobacteria bacterium]
MGRFILALVLGSSIFTAGIVFIRRGIDQTIRPALPPHWSGVTVGMERSVPPVVASAEEVAVSADGTRVAYRLVGANGRHEVRVWDESGDTFEAIGGRDSIQSVAISGDGLTVAALGCDGAATCSGAVWREGLGLSPIHGITFEGKWRVLLTEGGTRVLFFPGENTSAFVRDGSRARDIVIADLDPRSGAFAIRAVPPTEIGSTIRNDGRQAASLIDSDRSRMRTLSLLGRSAPNDIDGDRRFDLITFLGKSPNPVWRALSTTGLEFSGSGEKGSSSRFTTWRVGDSDGMPLVGDFNGDGVNDLATYRRGAGRAWSDGQENANWTLLLSAPVSGDSGQAVVPARSMKFFWGDDEGLPLVGDFDGDGATDVATYSPPSRQWFVLLSRGGFNRAKAGLKIAGYGGRFRFGASRAIPVPGDYDGDGRDELVLFELRDMGRTSRWIFFGGNVLELGADVRKHDVMEFGELGDIPVPADYDGDGRMDLAVYRQREGQWFIRSREGRDWSIGFGGSVTAEPLAGDVDGDGKADPILFDSQGPVRWMIRNSRVQPPAGLTVAADAAVDKIRWGHPDLLPWQIIQRRLAIEVATSSKESD